MFKSFSTVLLAGVLGTLLAVGQTVPCAAAASDDMPAPSTAMPQGAPEKTPPPGFVSFCIRYADQCTASGTTDSIELNQANWSLLEAVNQKVNNAIWPEVDARHYGRAEFWTIPTDGYGDCEDYALTKRQALIKAGVPERALRIAVVKTGRNNLHAVLTVTTSQGSYVLDNLSDDVQPWSQTGYEWLARQDDSGAWGWVAFNSEGEQLMATAAISD